MTEEQRNIMKYLEKDGFKLLKDFPEEYILLYKHETGEKIRVYPAGGVIGPY